MSSTSFDKRQRLCANTLELFTTLKATFNNNEKPQS